MSEPGSIIATQDQHKVIVDGLSSDPNSEWEVHPLASDRVFLRSKKAAKRMLDSFETSGRSSAEVLCDLVMGLQSRGWTGVVATEVDSLVRKMFFAEGNLVFATSNLIDDRLGEVIYRNGQINIDQLMTSAALVNCEKKFGRVLRESGVFDHLGLWRALQTQMRLIVSSIFMVDELYYEIQSKASHPTKVALDKPTPEFLQSCYSFGCLFRHFKTRLRSDSKIVMADHYLQNIDRYPGTFIGDFLGLVREPLTIDELIASSKLEPSNTLTVLMHLYNKKICSISPMSDPRDDAATHGNYLHLARSLAIYQSVLEAIHTAFLNENIEFPAHELRNLCDSMNVHGSQMFFLDGDGQFLTESVGFMHASCRGVQGREEMVSLRVNSVTTFLLQIAGDHLSGPAIKTIRDLHVVLSQAA